MGNRSIIELVRCYGGPVSHAALDPRNSIFQDDDTEGLIIYRVIKCCAVVFGDPVCAPEKKSALSDAYTVYCDVNGWSIVYSAVSVDMQIYAKGLGYASIEFAQLMMTDPQQDPELGHQGHHLRQHLNFTRRAGVTVREYLGLTMPDTILEAKVELVCVNWLSKRQGLQMYLGQPRLFDHKFGRRWFVAEQAGSVIGMLSMLGMGQLKSHNLINLVFSLSSAPLYTNELMVVSALAVLGKEGVDSVSLGVGPLTELGEIDCCNGISKFLSRNIYLLVNKVMGLQGRSVFWKKFNVTDIKPLYLIFNSPNIGLREINALFCAFNFSLS
ncbi:MAG: phosphatidylglycerol lysyltransferase domain-containing protein [Methylococcales bacterium]